MQDSHHRASGQDHLHETHLPHAVAQHHPHHLLPSHTDFVFDSSFEFGEDEIASAAKALSETQDLAQGDGALAPLELGFRNKSEMDYAESVRNMLVQMNVPDMVTNFVSLVWTQALLRTLQHGRPTAKTETWAKAAVQLVMSTQPKTTLAQREALERTMPILVFNLQEGMDLLGMPYDDQESFWRSLMPIQAEALRGSTVAALVGHAPEGKSTVQQVLERMFMPHLHIDTSAYPQEMS